MIAVSAATRAVINASSWRQAVSVGSDQVDLAGIHWGRRDDGDRMFSQYAYFSAGIDLGPLDYVCSCGGGGR